MSRAFRGSIRGRRYLDVTNEPLSVTISRGRERGNHPHVPRENSRIKFPGTACDHAGCFQVSHAIPRTPEAFGVDLRERRNVEMIFYFDVQCKGFSAEINSPLISPA